ncbi:MAG: 2-amino-4-hydroxy-6-hydroxymethyldihydropteridine diphosphokinase [Planctomycetota bacterium]|jgi:2-amino-4-hydroxy-6-hydroxymethyldihydropteridine diphosphokinase
MRAALGLGSNLGDRRRFLERAVERLPGVVAVSGFIETDPVGGPPQGRYLNAAVVIETGLEPKPLLDLALSIERESGRERTGERWGPRPLDIDILLYGDRVVDQPGLTVPHPRLAERAFALGPLREIAPDWVVPGTGRTVTELHADLPSRS